MTDRRPIGSRGRATLMAALAVMAWLVGAGAAPGQVGTPIGEASGEITIACDWFGVGGFTRTGEWAGIRLTVSDSSERPREVVLRISGHDADGDRPMEDRVVTTNPGVKQPVWMYLRLPAWFRQSDVLTVSAFEGVEQTVDAAGWGVGTGRLLGIARINASIQPLDAAEGMIGVLGQRYLGLRKYSIGASGESYLPTGHERSQIVAGLSPGTLPDRWQGLMQFDVLVWGDGSPGALTMDGAQAIREWVQRGGHLVVVLPRVGQTWTDEVNNPLFDITPRVGVTRREGMDLEPYKLLITEDKDQVMPTNEVVQVLTPLEDSQPGEAVRVLVGPEMDTAKECLVARRLVGTGAVTLVGLDIATRWLDGRGLPDPEMFWHRILGRRGNLITEQEYGSLATKTNYDRQRMTLDRDIDAQIDKKGTAAAGVLIGFVVFVTYWLVAGPGMFAVLKKTGLTRHAWVAFLGTAALFTAIAWGGATAIRPGRIEASHLTFLDHVYGQPIERTRSWISLLIPQYGEAGLSLEDPGARGGGAGGGSGPGRMHNLIAPWEKAGITSAGTGFPDARAYRIRAETPDLLSIPTRSTVKQFQLDWAGPPRVPMPHPVARPGDKDAPAIRLMPRSAPGTGVEGILQHEFKEPLKNVVILINRGQRDITASMRVLTPQSTLADTVVYKLNQWSKDEPLDLGALGDSRTNAVNAVTYFDDLVQRPTVDASMGGDSTDTTLSQRLNGLAFFSQLAPPDFNVDPGRSKTVAQRKSSHGWDLGVWFTQPCVIVVGQLGDSAAPAPSPTPIYSDAGGRWREVASVGCTVIRWVYPLDSRPPEIVK